MNLFFLDLVPYLCALYHCDKHVVKMILENAELLSCAHWLTGGTEAPYKLMKNHKRFPSVAWLLESIKNYRWTVEMGLALCAEYTHRYGKVHAAQVKIEWLKAHEPNNIPDVPMTTLPPAVPAKCLRQTTSGEVDTIASYKAYYIVVKRYFAKWTKRKPPQWFTDGVANMTDDERKESDELIEGVKAGKKRKSEAIKKSKEKKLKQAILIQAKGDKEDEDSDQEVKKKKKKGKPQAKKAKANATTTTSTTTTTASTLAVPPTKKSPYFKT